MTTRIFTPRPAQPAAKRATGAMEGWRIEVRRSLHGFDAKWWTPDDVEMRVYMFALQPGRITEFYSRERRHPGVVWAAVRLDRDTIYVSRELTGDEPDTLRRLMAEECGRERSEAVKTDESFSCDLIATLSGTAGSGMYEDLARNLNAALGIGDEPVGVFDRVHSGTIPGHPNGVGLLKTIGTPLGCATCGGTGSVLSRTDMVPRRCVDCEGPAGCCASHGDGIAREHAPAAPRVPKVGDEIEARGHGGWRLARCMRQGNLAYDAEWLYLERAADHRYEEAIHPSGIGKTWRWPEQAKSEAPLVQQAPTKGSSGWVKLADLGPKEQRYHLLTHYSGHRTEAGLRVSWHCIECSTTHLGDVYSHFDATCKTRHRTRCSACRAEYELVPQAPNE